MGFGRYSFREKAPGNEVGRSTIDGTGADFAGRMAKAKLFLKVRVLRARTIQAQKRWGNDEQARQSGSRSVVQPILTEV
jgi:hypothetical protein